MIPETLALVMKADQVLDTVDLDIQMQPHTDASGKVWVYLSFSGSRSFRVDENGFWEQIGGSGRFGSERFGKTSFEQAVCRVIECFRADLARKKFMKDGKIGECENRELILLGNAGWLESCPTEHAWHFSHPDFPGVLVSWRHPLTVEATL